MGLLLARAPVQITTATEHEAGVPGWQDPNAILYRGVRCSRKPVALMPTRESAESVCAALLGVLTLHEETDDPDGPHTREASKATSERLGAR
ncbi:MAG TPA: hypothetical protein VFC15_06465 [Candidatus Limnocylindrales bacterium]|nr:hypothetical protein [Candidatus Limnocylindrales bacterium]